MKRRLNHKKTVAWMLSLLLFLLPSMVSASATVHVQTDTPSVQAGDTVEVMITVNGNGMAIAEGVFLYDPAVLTYAEGEGGASDGFLNMVSAQKGGASTLTARIRFTATGAGSTQIEASIEKIIGYDGQEQPGAKASVSVTVSTPAPTPAPTPLNYAAEGVPAQNVKNATESMYIWRTLENVTIPSGYSVTTLDYHGEAVAAATAEDSGAPTLLYLSNTTGDVGGYYIYNAAANSLYPYQTISSVSKSYILLEPDGSVALPEGFFETTLTIGEKEYPAWRSQDAQGEVYLLYARNPAGETGYYIYSAKDESLQRYAVLPARPLKPSLSPEAQSSPAPEQAPAVTPAPEQANEITLNKTVFYMICAIGAILLLAVAGLLIARLTHKKRRRAAREHAHQEIGQ